MRHLTIEETIAVSDVFQDFRPLMDKLIVDHLNKVEGIESKVRLMKAMSDAVQYISYRITFDEAGVAKVSR